MNLRIETVPMAAGRVMAILAAFLSANLGAQEQLTPASLAAWNVRGAPPAINAGQGTVTVPAGSELFRLLAPGQVTVRLISRPFFSPDLAGLPALEVGPSTLTFTRDETGGALVLLGDQPLSLPFAIALDPDGRSHKHLDFTLGYDQPRSTASLLLDGRTFEVVTPATTAPIGITVTAGATSSWTLDTLEVQGTPAPAADSLAASGRPNADQSGGKSKSAFESGESAPSWADITRLAVAGDLNAVKLLLKDMNRYGATPRGRLENARLLVRLAFELSGAGRVDIATELAEEASRECEKVQKDDSNSGFAATAWGLMAFLQERFHGDHAAAAKSYRSAIQLAPGQSYLMDRLERLEKAAANLRQDGATR